MIHNNHQTFGHVFRMSFWYPCKHRWNDLTWAGRVLLFPFVVLMNAAALIGLTILLAGYKLLFK